MSPYQAREHGARVRFGEAMRRGEYPTQARYPSGFWSAAGRGATAGWRLTKERWASLNDTSDVLSANAFKALVGDRKIEFRPGMTEQQAEARIAEYDYDQRLQSLEGRPVAEFLGFAATSLLDPVNVATLPIGGASFARAATATTMRQALRHAAAGGAKVGIASAPLEVAVQMQSYGEVRPDELAASVAAPVLLSPLLMAPGRALRGMSQRRTQQRFDAARNVDNPHAMDEATLRGAEDDLVPPPPVRSADLDGDVPQARLREAFDSYEGGARRWVSDLANNAPSARELAGRLGIDPDAAPIRALLARQARLTAQRTPPPEEARFTQIQDLLAAAQGRAEPEQWARLQSAGLAGEAEHLAAGVRGTVGGQIPVDAMVASAARRVERLEGEVRQMLLREEFSELGEALLTPDFARTHPQRLLARTFMERGAEGVTARRLNTLERQYDGLLEQIAALSADLRSRRGRKPKALTEQLEALKAQRAALAAEMEALGASLRRVDDEIPLEDILSALDAARLESRPAPRPALSEAAPEDATRALLDADPELERIALEFQRAGFDTAEAESLVARVDKLVQECAV